MENVKIGEDTTVVQTKYPEIVEAAQNQNIPIKNVFAQIIEGENEFELKYPVVKLNGEGSIPIDGDGDAMLDTMRLRIAKAFAVKNNQQDVLDNLNALSEDNDGDGVTEDADEEMDTVEV